MTRRLAARHRRRRLLGWRAAEHVVPGGIGTGEGRCTQASTSHRTPFGVAKDGRITPADWNGGYGNAVIIDHGGGFSTLYGHMTPSIRGRGRPDEPGRPHRRHGLHSQLDRSPSALRGPGSQQDPIRSVPYRTDGQRTTSSPATHSPGQHCSGVGTGRVGRRPCPTLGDPVYR